MSLQKGSVCVSKGEKEGRESLQEGRVLESKGENHVTRKEMEEKGRWGKGKRERKFEKGRIMMEVRKKERNRRRKRKKMSNN